MGGNTAGIEPDARNAFQSGPYDVKALTGTIDVGGDGKIGPPRVLDLRTAALLLQRLVELDMTEQRISSRRANSVPYSEIPYTTEQGILEGLTGNFFKEQGILAPKQRIRPRTNFLTLRAPKRFQRPCDPCYKSVLQLRCYPEIQELSGQVDHDHGADYAAKGPLT